MSGATTRASDLATRTLTALTPGQSARHHDVRVAHA